MTNDRFAMTAARVARELDRLDTPARRDRAVNEAHTVSNLLGGQYTARLSEAVTTILTRIEQGRESDELYGERITREHYEAETMRRIARGQLV